MSQISLDAAVEQLVAVLDEGLHGPPPNYGYYSDRGPTSGLLNLLPSISAEEASQPVGGSSIAAHAYHLVFCAPISQAFIVGKSSPGRLERQLGREVR